jgi:hypothetical protein
MLNGAGHSCSRLATSTGPLGCHVGMTNASIPAGRGGWAAAYVHQQRELRTVVNRQASCCFRCYSTELNLKNDIFWEVAPCTSIISRCFGGTCRFNLYAFTSFCLLTSLTDSNKLFLVVILVLSYLLVSLVPYLHTGP